GIRQKEYSDLESVIAETDVLYMTRIQRERFTDQIEYERVKDSYIINNATLSRSKPNMIVMHPFPRVNEIDPEVDFDDRAVYFRQMKYGMFVRMALLAMYIFVLCHISIQSHMNALFDIIRAPNKYFGLKAIKPIKEGSFIVEPIETPVEINNLEFHMDKYMSEGLWRTYFPPSDTSEINNAAKKGRLSRFIAHSRNPNCHEQEWLVGNQTRTGIFASRDISDGDELTIDYTESSMGYGKPRKVKEQNGSDVTPEEVRPLEDNQGIFNYIGRMLQAVYRPDLATQVLHNLEITTDENVLRKFLNLDGLKILSLWFHEHSEPKLIERIISVLEKLPLQYNDLDIMTEIKGSLKMIKINDDGLHDRVTRLLEKWRKLHAPSKSTTANNSLKSSISSDRDKQTSHSSKKSDKVKTMETCSEKKQKTPEPSSTLGCISLLPANTSSSQLCNEEPGSSHVANANMKTNNVESIDDTLIQPPSITASDENSFTRTFNKDKFRDEFAAAVVEYSERFKSQIEERTLTKHVNKCIELCFGKEMRLAEVESVTSGNTPSQISLSIVETISGGVETVGLE
ncbi:17229_t:CDS:10, partial [Dentiscutata heterogama]